MPSHLTTREEENSEESHFVIPGLPHLSKKLVDSNEGTAPSSRLERDLEVYEKKCKLYFSKIAGEARLKEKSELDIPDPLLFWIAQVNFQTLNISLHNGNQFNL